MWTAEGSDYLAASDSINYTSNLTLPISDVAFAFNHNNAFPNLRRKLQQVYRGFISLSWLIKICKLSQKILSNNNVTLYFFKTNGYDTLWV